MQTVKEFGGNTAKMSLMQFWLNTGPVLAGVLVITQIVILWKGPTMAEFRTLLSRKLFRYPWKLKGRAKELRPVTAKPKHHATKRLPWSLRKKISDPETPSLQEQALTRPNSHKEALAGPPPPHPGEGSEGSSI